MQVQGVLKQVVVPHCWVELNSWEVVVGEVVGEAQSLVAEGGVVAVVGQYSKGVEMVVVVVVVVGEEEEVLVLKIQVQVGVEEEEEVEEEGWLLEEEVQGEEMRSYVDLLRCSPQAENVCGCLCCPLGERAG